MLNSAAENLGSLQTTVRELDFVVQQAADIPLLSSVSNGFDVVELESPRPVLHERVPHAPSMMDYRSSTQSEQATRWLYFKWGLGIGSGLVVALLIAILVIMHHHGR